VSVQPAPGAVRRGALLHIGRENPPWLFGILSIPYGTFNAILVTLIPFLLRKHGVSPDRIANVIAISSIPNVWYFLWSPVVDIGLPRRA